MATSPKTATNAQHAAFPNLFKRTGEARRVKGYRASRETFSRAVRMAKALDSAESLTVYTPTCAMVLSVAATTLLKQDEALSALLLNGFVILPTHSDGTLYSLNDFLHERNIHSGTNLVTADMFDDDETEHLGKGSR